MKGTSQPMAEKPDISWQQLLAEALTKPGTVSKAYSAFHSYSTGNQLLAWLECKARGIEPGPIATYPGWQRKGRHIRNNWFVLSQTDGAEYVPEPLPSWDESQALRALSVTRETFTETDGNVQGYARQRSIAISPLAENPHKTTFHELAHILLGHTEQSTLTDSERTPRSLREVEAESVALLVCESLGLPGAECSRGYIQGWADGLAAIPERSCQRIFKAADQIIKAGLPKQERQDS